MLYAIGSKLVSESLLSLYPVLVKNLAVPFDLQLWSRFFTYSVISMLFVNWDFVSSNLISKDGVLLALVTSAHIYTSYKGFILLESGISYTLFYFYPMLILLFSGEPINPAILLAIFGVFLLYNENKTDKNNWFGIVMIALAAVTEALIYFIVRRLKTTNNWNHVFLSYFMGSLVLTGILYNRIYDNIDNQQLTMSLLSNGVIGLVGYFLRFFAITHLEPGLYAPLSYFGVIMSHVYGVLINGEQITATKTIGTLCIIASNIR